MIEDGTLVMEDSRTLQMCANCRRICRITPQTPFYIVPLKELTNHIKEPKSNLLCHQCYQDFYNLEHKEINELKKSVEKLVKLLR